MSEGYGRISWAGRVRLGARILVTFVRVVVLVRRQPMLPELIESLGRVTAGVRAKDRFPPRALGIAVHRCLEPFRARCLFQSLVFYRLLREQDERAEVVIGLPLAADNERAHSWVEIDGIVVGPPPGRMRHEPMGRFA